MFQVAENPTSIASLETISNAACKINLNAAGRGLARSRIIRLSAFLLVGGLLAQRCRVSMRSSMSSMMTNTARYLELHAVRGAVSGLGLWP